MSDLEARIQRIEDRIALEEVLQNYYAAVDTMHDIDGIVACFTPDAVFDVVDLGLPRFVGHDQIREFFTGVFADTLYHAHHVSNFRIKYIDGDKAAARGYVIGKAEGKTGFKVLVYCHYDIEYARTAQGWKMTLFDEGATVPIGDEVSELHAHAS